MIVKAVLPPNTDIVRFLAASLALHALTLALLHFQPRASISHYDTIPVSVLPEPAASETSNLTRIPRPAPSRPSKTPAILARKDSPPQLESRGKETAQSAKGGAYRDHVPPEPIAPPDASRPARQPFAPAPLIPAEGNIIVTERELPTVKDLLPSANWSASERRSSAPVSLNTKDPVYVSYFNKIKQSIELQWEYPELALRYGLQGRLSLEFAITSTGQLEWLRILRSSGSQVLDDEALRAIKTAAPFPPIPSWIKANPLLISASMEYYDNRVNYQFSR